MCVVDFEMEVDAKEEACLSGKRKRPTQSRHQADTKPTQSRHKKVRSDAKSAESTSDAVAMKMDEEDDLLTKELEKINIGARKAESEDHACPPRSSAPVANYYLAYGSGPDIKMPLAVLGTKTRHPYSNALDRIRRDNPGPMWKPILSTLWQRTSEQMNPTGDSMSRQ